MGTLVNDKNSGGSNKRVKNSEFDGEIEVAISEKHRKKYEKLEIKLEKEFQKFRSDFEEVRQAFRYVDDASSHDDIYFRLLKLEKAVSGARKGSTFTRGAKTHRKLLSVLNEFPIE